MVPRKLPVAIWLWCVATSVAMNDEFNIELKQKDAEVYHEQSFGRNEFNYGYQVEKTNSQFQHKAKGPDDVTYGCYGYIDPVGEKHLVYYIADRLGYRLLAPDQPTKVFTERVANSVNKLDAELQGRKLDEKVVAWNDLYLPSTCRRLDEIVSITPPPTVAPPVVQTTTARNGATGSFGGSQAKPNGAPSTIGNGPLGGDQGKVNLGNPTTGAQRPFVNESSSATGQTTGDGGSAGPPGPQEKFAKGTGVSEEPPRANEGTPNGEEGDSNAGSSTNPDVEGAGNSSPNGGPNQGLGANDGTDGLGLPQSTTQQPSATEKAYIPPSSSSEPAAKPIDPIDRATARPSIDPNAPKFPVIVEEPAQGTPSCAGAASPPPPPAGPQLPPSPSIGQFNGFVFPINRDCDASGRSTAELLAQMQTLNELVLKVSHALHAKSSDGSSGTCQRVLELLNIQQPVPLLVYVPIMMPYLDAAPKRPPINPASYAYARSCSECK